MSAAEPTYHFIVRWRSIGSRHWPDNNRHNFAHRAITEAQCNDFMTRVCARCKHVTGIEFEAQSHRHDLEKLAVIEEEGD